ncbi:hypothetical protein P7C71_g4586, partial [Lecanoromycetidae sp. Uapishka_2]
MFSLSSSSLFTITISLGILLQAFLSDAHPSPSPAPTAAAQLSATSLKAAIEADAATNTTALLLEVLELPRSSAPTDASAVISAVAQAAPTSIPEAEEEFVQVVLSGILRYTVDEVIDSKTPPPPSVNPPYHGWPPIYPKKCFDPVPNNDNKCDSKDAPYSLTETELRSAIDIPPTFTYGGKPPVIIVPGTASTTNMTFAHNLFKELADSAFADIVWINNPGLSVEDAQVNAEYVAYAINYISSISHPRNGDRNVSVIAFSQGTTNTQWALKYWPSTRYIVSDFIALSPEFHGSTVSTLIYETGCAPGFFQHGYDSNYIAALRSDGGDSAYVPTTTVYSSADQYAFPQSGTNATGYMLDARGVGVTNNEVQLVCPAQPAGSAYTHEGILFNALTYGLIKDALENHGPGNMSRLGHGLCADYKDPKLDVTDMMYTESVAILQTYNLLTYPDPVSVEPPLMSYAKQ